MKSHSTRLRYTLIELLISMGIFTLLLLFCVRFLGLYADRIDTSTIMTEQISDTTVLFGQVERDLQGVFTHALADGTKITAIELSGQTITFTARTRLDETGSGLGGMTMIQYGINGSKLLRRAENVLTTEMTASAFSAAKTAVAAKNSDTLCSGIETCTWRIYTTRAAFLAGTPSLTSGTFYANPTQPLSGAVNAYAVELSVKLKHPNEAVTAQDKHRNVFTKIFVLN